MKKIKQFTGLSIEELREIERQLGIYLQRPVNPNRSIREQFGVYDENGNHVGDIMAKDDDFFFFCR